LHDPIAAGRVGAAVAVGFESMSVSGAVRLDIAGLRAQFLAREISAAELADRVLRRIALWDDPALFISRTDDATIRARARCLDEEAAADASVIERRPLFGIPFAVKDNIDVALMPTTAGCPAFAYTPTATAPVVARLVEAGAVLVGKTNLDQFATGLVGTRSPYGVPRNPIDARLIPGGSSSGSAVAVAAGLAGFALGTDTAGSGRVPAACNNIVGLKPSRGRLSTRGIVPACRSLDCVSVFAATVRDAAAVFAVIDRFDPGDPFSRRPQAGAPASFDGRFRFGVPREGDLEFFGDAEARHLFGAAVRRLENAGGTRVGIGFAPFRETGQLLYGGPWIAERLHAAAAVLARDPEGVLPLTRSILEGGRSYSALDAFRSQYRLMELRRTVDDIFATIDCLLLPTVGTVYKVAAVAAEPLRLNANLGFYTDFANLLDLAVLALPAGWRDGRLPFGISLLAPAFSDHALIELGSRLEAAA
jgi:allophanate hydrolase